MTFPKKEMKYILGLQNYCTITLMKKNLYTRLFAKALDTLLPKPYTGVVNVKKEHTMTPIKIKSVSRTYRVRVRVL